MSQQKRTTSHSMRDLTKIYQFNDDITESRTRILFMTYSKQKSGATINKRRNICIEDLRVRVDRLTLMRHDEIMRIYSHVKLIRNWTPPPPLPPRRSRQTLIPPRRPQQRLIPPIGHKSEPISSSSSSSSSSSAQVQPITSPQPPPILLEITNIDIKDNSIKVDMARASYKANEPVIDDIIYPEGVTDLQPYKTVARYRKVIGKSIDFRREPLLVGDDSTETLVLGLQDFAQRHGCMLSFTDEDEQFDQSIYHASYGLVDLGSIHLMATDSLLTANFQFEIDLDYDNEFAQSEDNIRKFVHDFCDAIANVLSCENNNVRVFSIHKLADEAGKSQVNFGLTTPEPERTEQIAHNLQDTARSGFPTDTVLRHVKPREYECTWKPVLTHLKIRPSDLDPRFNFDYRKPDVPEELERGNHPYYLPRGWYRHALNVLDKYEGSQMWLGCINAEGEWPVAFHGTHAGAVSGIVQQGLLPSTAKTDAVMDEAIEQMGEEANRPGLYVATHCNGGSHPQYTVPFDVPVSPHKSEQFRIVFQCRVEPNKFTIHTTPVRQGQAWRLVDPKAVRPYGILVKKEDPAERMAET